MTAGTLTRRMIAALVLVLAVALAVPATGMGARPNPGKWDSMDWSRDFNFIVKGKKHPRIANFNPQWRMYWTCPDTGEEVWTEVSGLGARVARGGGFSSSATMFVSGLGRMLTVNLSGRFGSRTRASGSLLWSLQGCGTQLDQWSAYGPATKHKKKKGGGGGGGGGGGSPGGCIWIPLPDGSGFICV